MQYIFFCTLCFVHNNVLDKTTHTVPISLYKTIYVVQHIICTTHCVFNIGNNEPMTIYNYHDHLSLYCVHR